MDLLGRHNGFKNEALRPGNVLEGPAIIEGEYTTVVVPPSMLFSVDDRGLGILESLAAKSVSGGR